MAQQFLNKGFISLCSNNNLFLYVGFCPLTTHGSVIVCTKMQSIFLNECVICCLCVLYVVKEVYLSDLCAFMATLEMSNCGCQLDEINTVIPCYTGQCYSESTEY